MCYLAEKIYDVSRLLDDISEEFMDIGDWFYNEMDWYWMYRRFLDVSDFFWEAGYNLSRAAYAIDDWWDVIYETRDWFYELYDYAHWWLTDKANAAYDYAATAIVWAIEALSKVNAIAGVIGTTFTEIVAFIKEHATIIYNTVNEYVTNVYQTFEEYITNVYETIVENIYNTYNTFKEFITNVYETIQNYYNTYVTEIIGVAEEWVIDFVAAALAPFAAPINLVNLWFNSIQDFFNDPLGWLLDRFGDWFFGPET